MLYTMIPEGYERIGASVLSCLLTPFIRLMVQVLSCSVVPLCVIMLYAFGYAIASGIASVFRHDRTIRFSAKRFYVEYVMFIPLVVSMSGVISGKLFRVDWLWTVSWNALIASGLFFIVQGYGIFSFFLRSHQSENEPFSVFLDYVRPL